MIRKQIYIEPEQNARLKHVAQESGLSEAELIRQAIGQHLWSPRLGRRSVAAWEAEKVFIHHRMESAVAGGSRSWSRDELHER